MKFAAVQFAALAFCIGSAIAAPVPGEPAPDFVGTTAQGGTVALSQLRGRPVVLEWTNHRCPFVRKHYGTGNMQRLQNRLTEDGAVWISVISSGPGKEGHVSPSEAQAIATRNASYATHVVLDPTGEIGRLYGARTTPHMFLIDTGGRLAYMGAIDDRPSTRYRSVDEAQNYLLAAYEEMRAGEAISAPVTRPYGCAVYYGD